jgi:aspartokinase/homoserine dehydrogenase 1
MTSISVHKFGGAALADAGSIRRVVELIQSATSGRRVIVVSALAGVTDQLLRASHEVAMGNIADAMRRVRELRFRHDELVSQLLGYGTHFNEVSCAISGSFDELESLIVKLGNAHDSRPDISETIVARGEQHAALIVRAALNSAGVAAQMVDAGAVVHIDGQLGNVSLDIARMEIAMREHVTPLLEKDQTVVIPGFFGRAADGSLLTLGRGGSDLTATAVARALGAATVTLWKDVPGLLTADPRIVPDARVLRQLDSREASELAYYGAQVLHPRALLPLDARTTLRIRPFADRKAPGTEIVMREPRGGSPVSALSVMNDQALIVVVGSGASGAPAMTARVFGALARVSASVSMISQGSSEQSICFTVPVETALAVESALQLELADELVSGVVAKVEVIPGVATVAVVGRGISRTAGAMARVFSAVADARVNIIAIAQGSSQRNVSFVVETGRAGDAVRAIHRAFRLDKIGGGRASRARGVDVILMGCGRIGRELLVQLAGLDRGVRERIRLIAIIDRSGFVFAPRGFSTRYLATVNSAKGRGESVAQMSGGCTGTAHDAIAHIATHALTSPVVVDVSSGDTRDALLLAIEHGMNLVLANKIPLASDGASAHALLAGAHARGRYVMHEATVGAGLPIIDTIAKLTASGDRILSISGCPSGTMGYLFGELGRGRSFSDSLRGALALGYTEPDPRDDLSGADVARKALILARLIGFNGEPDDIAVESLIPESLRDVSLPTFLEQLQTMDEEWRCRVDCARERDEILRYRVHVTRRGARVGLVSVPLTSALANLVGTDNQFTITTARYRENPIVITGPGAGAAVTAGGVLSDLLRVARI